MQDPIDAHWILLMVIVVPDFVSQMHTEKSHPSTAYSKASKRPRFQCKSEEHVRSPKALMLRLVQVDSSNGIQALVIATSSTSCDTLLLLMDSVLLRTDRLLRPLL